VEGLAWWFTWLLSWLCFCLSKYTIANFLCALLMLCAVLGESHQQHPQATWRNNLGFGSFVVVRVCSLSAMSLVIAASNYPHPYLSWTRLNKSWHERNLSRQWINEWLTVACTKLLVHSVLHEVKTSISKHIHAACIPLCMHGYTSCLGLPLSASLSSTSLLIISTLY